MPTDSLTVVERQAIAARLADRLREIGFADRFPRDGRDGDEQSELRNLAREAVRYWHWKLDRVRMVEQALRGEHRRLNDADADEVDALAHAFVEQSTDDLEDVMVDAVAEVGYAALARARDSGLDEDAAWEAVKDAVWDIVDLVVEWGHDELEFYVGRFARRVADARRVPLRAPAAIRGLRESSVRGRPPRRARSRRSRSRRSTVSARSRSPGSSRDDDPEPDLARARRRR